MNTQNTYKINDLKAVLNSDRAMALIAITAHQESTQEACLSDEQLAVFVNGELKGEQRQSVLAHLNACSQCYHHWLETASYLKSLGTSQKRKPFFKKNVFGKGWQNSLNGLSFFLDNLKFGVPVAATAVLLVIVALKMWPMQPVAESPIEASYRAVLTENHQGFNPVLEYFPLETTDLGFNEVERSEAAQAFQAGIETGYAMLSQTSADISVWKETDWGAEYDLGRWFVLLWTMAQTPDKASSDFWAKQQAIGETLQARFSQRASEEMTETVLETLKRIQPVLMALKKQPAHRAVAYELSDHLEMAMSGLAEF
ncbi:MAG: hypothetical protein VSS75_001915 [Candidatus Parabeggiatoa sp.]|nr:hypothetical protein [Candidatus Parabeggiatoa sp.]